MKLKSQRLGGVISKDLVRLDADSGRIIYFGNVERLMDYIYDNGILALYSACRVQQNVSYMERDENTLRWCRKDAAYDYDELGFHEYLTSESDYRTAFEKDFIVERTPYFVYLNREIFKYIFH